MSLLRATYLGLAIFGAVVPMYHFGLWFLGDNSGQMSVIEAWQVNAAATGLMWDLVIAAIALSIWMLAEIYVRRNWMALIALPATFLIGVSCGLPLYLYFRTRPID
ncbi:DUF2834 domain-containing protein [Falsihalocynthiibacter sp. SS001]|uniref:DUF2834 domain-containing protein n=1 Tax=Falsihalocynthiibacter sp. SS001 TaxID=3349698 RepID=UPI0036D2650E